MSAGGIADVVFCLDASHSMEPCLDGVKSHLVDFVAGLGGASGAEWDVRFDFVAHSRSPTAYRHVSVWNNNATLGETLYGAGNSRLFTSSPEEFRQGLERVAAHGNEASLVALDFCLDFPWRPASACRRAVILMTDEPFESGVEIELQELQFENLIRKIQQLRVSLYIVAPTSKMFDRLAAVDRSEFMEVDEPGSGLAGVDFGQVLGDVGRSVSRSALQGTGETSVQRGLFGQSTWVFA